MEMRIPTIRSITDLAREAKGLVAEARKNQEPIVITQRGHDVAVLLPMELYRRLEANSRPSLSPRLAHPEDAVRFTMNMTRRGDGE